jgi:hypothetical protein
LKSFSIGLNPLQQSSSVQQWLRVHDGMSVDYPIVDGIQVVTYQTEDDQQLCKVIFHIKDMTVLPMPSQIVFGMLYNRFNWSADRAERFQEDFGQLLEIKLPKIGSIYYAKVLDIDACEIRIDFK